MDRTMASSTIDWRETLPSQCQGGVVSIGNFDGVHRGHASLIAEARAQGSTQGIPAVALTFDPHPRELLRPEVAVPPLTTTADRARLLQELGTDQVVILRTTPQLLALSAADFFAQVIQERLRATVLVEGPNFGFGHKREGNIDMLTRLCRQAGIQLTVVPPLQLHGREVSSSQVRTALEQGNVREAQALLGRPYRLCGRVGTGQRRGRKLGFPTANLDPLDTLAPGNGVYAALAQLPGKSWPAAVNIGPNPTFGEQARKVEVHLIGYQGDLYGQSLGVDFLDRLRDTRPFAGPADLTAQLQQDVQRAVEIASQAR